MAAPEVLSLFIPKVPQDKHLTSSFVENSTPLVSILSLLFQLPGISNEKEGFEIFWHRLPFPSGLESLLIFGLLAQLAVSSGPGHRQYVTIHPPTVSVLRG